MTSEGFSITVFIVGCSFGRVFSFRSGFLSLPGIVFGAFFNKTICGVFYPDCVGQGSASELTSLRSPRDLNGYSYFHARLGWTGFGLRANIVEKYVLFRAVLHWSEIVLTLSFTSSQRSAAILLVLAVTLGNLGVLL